jgi:hypothetical protein
MTSLTAAERETVVNWSDADDEMTVWTAQRPIITKLKRNPAATLVEEGHHGTTAWALFRLPTNLLTFRTPRKGRAMTDEQRMAASERLRVARKQRHDDTRSAA